MKLRFTPEALAELDAVLSGIADKSPAGAVNVRRRIEATLDRLVDHPLSGLRTSLPSIRRVLVQPYPYVIFYEPAADAVVVIAVRHAARDPFSMPGGQDDPTRES